MLPTRIESCTHNPKVTLSVLKYAKKRKKCYWSCPTLAPLLFRGACFPAIGDERMGSSDYFSLLFEKWAAIVSVLSDSPPCLIPMVIDPVPFWNLCCSVGSSSHYWGIKNGEHRLWMSLLSALIAPLCCLCQLNRQTGLSPGSMQCNLDRLIFSLG